MRAGRGGRQTGAPNPAKLATFISGPGFFFPRRARVHCSEIVLNGGLLLLGRLLLVIASAVHWRGEKRIHKFGAFTWTPYRSAKTGPPPGPPTLG